MKRNLLIVLLVGALGVALLPGCAEQPFSASPGAELKVPTNLSEAGQQVQRLINETNVDLTTAYKVVDQQLKDDVMPAADGADILNQLDAQSKKVDSAQALLDAGNVGDANAQAQLLQIAITALQKKAAAYRKEVK